MFQGKNGPDSRAFTNLDKAGGTAKQKTIDGSGGAASLLTGQGVKLFFALIHVE